MKHLIILMPFIGFFQTACQEPTSKRSLPTAVDTIFEEITPPKKRAFLTNYFADLTAVLDSTNSQHEELLKLPCFSKITPEKLEYRRLSPRVESVPGIIKDTHYLITPPGSQFKVVLPDGTRVWLNVGSVLSYPLEFGTERSVVLIGEAYFEITPCTWKGKKNPFRILTSMKNGSTPTEIESEIGMFNVDANDCYPTPMTLQIF